MFSSLLASALLLSTTLTSVVAVPVPEPVLRKRSDGLVAAYFGQVKQSSDDSLEKYCADDDIDIIVLAFLNLFSATGGLPESNFWPYTTETISGTDLATNPEWETTIPTCQANGKKVFLSLGGATGTQTIDTVAAATTLADQVWSLFGEGTDLEQYRPFGSAVLDGFDLDIENNDPNGWSTFISTMRTHFTTGTKTYYLSGAPQCPQPDAGLSTNVYLLDYLFVQFYNNYCGGSEANVVASFESWSTDIAANSQVGGKVFVGLPGSTAAAGSGYLDAATMAATVAAVKSYSNYGGVMTWDASYADANSDYLAALKAAA